MFVNAQAIDMNYALPRFCIISDPFYIISRPPCLKLPPIQMILKGFGAEGAETLTAPKRPSIQMIAEGVGVEGAETLENK